MAGPAIAPLIWGGAKLLGAGTAGVLGLNWFGNNNAQKEQERRAAALAPGVQRAYGDMLESYQQMPDFGSVTPRVEVPNYGAVRGNIAQGYGNARGELEQGFNNFTSGLRGAYDSRATGLGQMRDELGGMFNFGEDPYARALLNFTQGDIDARRLAASDGTRTAFGDAVSAIEAQRAGIDPAAAAAASQFIFDQAAASAAAANASTASNIAASDQAVVGVGPATGQAADIAQAIAASGGIAAEGARGDAELVQNTLAYLAANTTSAGASRQGELENTALSAQAAATKRFMEQEQARIAREREQFRDLEIGLRGQELMLDSDLQERLAGAGWDQSQSMSGLTLRESEALSGLDLAQEDARVSAANRFVDQIAGRNMDWMDQTSGPDTGKSINMGMDASAATLNGFRDYVNQVLASGDPMAAAYLMSIGIMDEASAKRYWEQNYKNAGARQYVPPTPQQEAESRSRVMSGESSLMNELNRTIRGN